MDDPSLAARLEREHRDLDALLGRFLAAAAHADVAGARDAITAFDDTLGRHTELEEALAIPEPPRGSKLVPPAAETDDARLFRELRLEHVQVREVSAMMRRLLDEKNDLEGARRLAANLARRWDAHTTREERALFPLLEGR